MKSATLNPKKLKSKEKIEEEKGGGSTQKRER